DQGDFGKLGDLGKTAREVKSDDGSSATQITALAAAEGAVAAGQLGPRRHAVTDLHSADAAARLQHAGAELVAEELNRGVGLQTPLDAVVSECGDALRQLRLGHARLNAQRLDEDVTGPALGHGDIFKPHVLERMETPGLDRLHACFPRSVDSSGDSGSIQAITAAGRNRNAA